METTTTAQQQAPKFSLENVVKGVKSRPLWVHLYSTPGLGKSTFGSKAPTPIFIDIEQGSWQLDVARFSFDEGGRTEPKNWPEVLAALRFLIREPHSYKSVVVDTLDALEPLVWEFICKRDGKDRIEDYGYARGYIAAVDEWRLLVATIEQLRAKGMNVITLAHSIIKTFKDPASEGWDRYQMKIHDKAAGLVFSRSDVVLFGNYEQFAAKDERTKRVRGVSTGARLIHTVQTPAWDAKNRHSLPEKMPLDWDTFYAAVLAHKPAEPTALIEAIKGNLGQLDAENQAKVTAALARAGNDSNKLAQLNDWLNGKLNAAA